MSDAAAVYTSSHEAANLLIVFFSHGFVLCALRSCKSQYIVIPSIITCLLPARDPPAESIHISSLPPSIPTDEEPEQTGAPGEEVCFVRSFCFCWDSSQFYETQEAFQEETYSATVK